MKVLKKTKSHVIFLLLTLTAIQAIAQQTPILTADSVKSGNTKDILTSFFQLAFNNLTGTHKEFNFTANPFAILLKKNPKLSIDKAYEQHTALRKLNFSLGLRLDSSYRFNGFSSGIKYSLIDKTDATTSDFIFLKLRNDLLNHQRDSLSSLLDIKLSERFPHPKTLVPSERKRYENYVTSMNSFLQDAPFNSLDKEFQSSVLKIVRDNHLDKVAYVIVNSPDSSFKSIDKAKMDALKKEIKKALLWTVGVSDTTYRDKFRLSNLVFASELSKGLFDPKPGDNSFEINLKAQLDLSVDTSKSAPKNLSRTIFSFEPGLNWVIRTRDSDRPLFGLKLSGSYYHNFAGLYSQEEREKITLNVTARFRLIQDIWIPLEIKYDPKTGNLFGLLNVRANFSGLKDLLK